MSEPNLIVLRHPATKDAVVLDIGKHGQVDSYVRGGVCYVPTSDFEIADCCTEHNGCVAQVFRPEGAKDL